MNTIPTHNKTIVLTLIALMFIYTIPGTLASSVTADYIIGDGTNITNIYRPWNYLIVNDSGTIRAIGKNGALDINSGTDAANIVNYAINRTGAGGAVLIRDSINITTPIYVGNVSQRGFMLSGVGGRTYIGANTGFSGDAMLIIGNVSETRREILIQNLWLNASKHTDVIHYQPSTVGTEINNIFAEDGLVYGIKYNTSTFKNQLLTSRIMGAQTAIYMPDGNNQNLIWGNDISGNSYGINLTGTANSYDIVIQNNDMELNSPGTSGGWAINVSGFADVVDISGNYFEQEGNTADRAIIIQGGAKNVQVHNNYAATAGGSASTYAIQVMNNPTGNQISVYNNQYSGFATGNVQGYTEVALVGQAYYGTWGSGSTYAAFGHNNFVLTGGGLADDSYSVLQDSSGQTFVNSAPGQPIRFNIGGTNKMKLESGGSLNLTYAGNGIGIAFKSQDGTTYCFTIANGGTTNVAAGGCGT